jgi:hypothetical protein
LRTTCPLQALGSFSARLDPRLALLDKERMERSVAQRVQRWAALGRRGDGEEAALAAVLAEDAAEVRQEGGGWEGSQSATFACQGSFVRRNLALLKGLFSD